jgi:ubiquitin carboxyl-terminal hydrolase 8
VTYIEPELPAASKELWSKRGMIDYIILLDWKSNIDQLKPGTALRTLKDAIFKVRPKKYPFFTPLSAFLYVVL